MKALKDMNQHEAISTIPVGTRVIATHPWGNGSQRSGTVVGYWHRESPLTYKLFHGPAVEFDNCATYELAWVMIKSYALPEEADMDAEEYAKRCDAAMAKIYLNRA